MKVVQLLGLWGPWQCQVCRDTDCLHSRSYGPIRVFFQAGIQKASLASLSLKLHPFRHFGGFPCLGSFSVVQCFGYIDGPSLAGVLLCRSVHQSLKGAPWVGFCSVVQCVRHLTASLSIVQLLMLACGERSYGDGSTHCV